MRWELSRMLLAKNVAWPLYLRSADDLISYDLPAIMHGKCIISARSFSEKL